MRHEKQYYDIPVFDFGGDNDINVQTTTNDANEYIMVTYDERQVGDPDLRAVHVRPDQRDSYRFRITDGNRRWCSYRDGSPDEVPTHIQHAVTAYGYGIAGLVEAEKHLFEWMAANEIHGRICEGLEQTEQPPIVNRLLEYTTSGVYDLGAMLLARFALPDDVYWGAFDEFNHSTPEEFVQNLRPLIDRFRKEISSTDAAALLTSDDEVKDLPGKVTYSNVSSDDGDYVLIDLIYEWGSYRFPFRKTNPDRCVYEGSNDVVVPPKAVTFLKCLDVELANRRFILDLSSGFEIGLGKDEMASMLADALTDYVWLCNRVDATAILPEEFSRSDQNLLLNAATNAVAMNSILRFAETEPGTLDAVYRDIASQYGLPEVDQLEHDDLSLVVRELIQRSPSEIQHMLIDRIDEISPSE